MTHLPEIWDCIKNNLPRSQWVALDDIYRLIEDNIELDKEDYEWQSPSSDIPKWKRNVRNVLQYRKNNQVFGVKSFILTKEMDGKIIPDRITVSNENHYFSLLA